MLHPSRKLTLSCLVLVLTAGLAVWFLRDLPRHLVVAVLENKLAARVQLQHFEILDAEHFRLTGLKIDRVRDYPFVESLTIEELLIDGPFRGVLDTRFDRISLAGVATRLAPAPAVDPPDRPLPIIAELIVEPASVRVAGGAGGGREDAVLTVEAALTGVGSQLGGEAHLVAPELLPESLFALAPSSESPNVTGEIRGLSATLRFDPAGRRVEGGASTSSLSSADLALELSEPRVSLSWSSAEATIAWRAEDASVRYPDGVVTAEEPEVAIRGTPKTADLWRLEIEPRLPWFASGRASAEWDAAARRLLGFEARLDELDLSRFLAGSGLTATATADVALHTVDDRLAYEVEIVPRRVGLSAERELETAGDSRVSIAGDLPWSPEDYRPGAGSGPLKMTVDLREGRGRWDAWRVPSAVFPLQARFDGRLLNLEPLQATGALELESAAVGGLKAVGELILAGDNPGADLDWTWTGSSLHRLAGQLREMGWAYPDFEIAGHAQASGRLAGPLTRPALQAEVRLRGVTTEFTLGEATPSETSRDAVKLTDGDADMSWSWDGEGAAIRLLSLAGTASVAAFEAAPIAVELRASGEVDSDLRSARVARATVSSPGLGDGVWEGRWRRGASGISATGNLTLRDIDLHSWQRALAASTGESVSDLEITGTLAAELTTKLEENSAWHLEGPARLAAAGFTSTDGSRVMEGLEGHWQLSANGGPTVPTELTARGQTGGFLLLWQTFFGDFSTFEAAIDVRARSQPAALDPSRPWTIEAGVGLPDGPAATAGLAGSADGSGLRYSLTLNDPDIATSHQRYLATALEERFGRLDLAGGLSVEVRGHLQPPDGERPALWDLAGRVALNGFHLRTGGGQAEVEGLQLDLPLDLRRRPTEELAFSGPRLGGRLAFDRLGLRGLDLPPTDSVLWVEADSVGLEESIALRILGGAVTFEHLSMSRLLENDRHLETALRLSNIRLEEVAESLALFPLEGELNGTLPRARLTPDRLYVEGGGEVEIFGGTVRLRDISGENVLTRFPKLEVSADFDNIDLGQLTRRIDFGEITGILRGSLEDCELFRGVPVRFTAQFETVARKGVPRTVDVKAINNLTILSTGQRSNIFDRGIQRFFKRYTYHRLGVDLRLDDDVLLMRGLEQRGDKELFLSGRLPFRIDVVNAEPGKTVSFQAMMRRLRSLDFTNATSQP